MVCKHCETENPGESVFCMHCGKRLDGKVFCPSCKILCPEEALYCNSCGARILKEPPVQENGGTQNVQTESPQPAAAAAPNQSTGTFEKVKKAFELSGGICLMAAVLFAFVFTFCLGLTATASGSSLSGRTSETTMIWHYFGDAYKDLAQSLEDLGTYSEYFEVSAYIPIILSTVIGAGTVLSVLILTVIAAVKYGRHFKKPDVRYAKYAIAAVLSFVLGATAFLAVNSTSVSLSSSMRISIHFSGASIAGIILSVLFLWLYCVSRVVMLGKDFTKKRTIINFVCSIAGILFAVLVAAFAASPAVFLKQVGSSSNNVGLNFSNSNSLISYLFPNLNKLSGEMQTNFIATYVTSAIAQGVQIALLVLAFVLLIKRASGLGSESKSCLGISIAMLALAAAYLVLTCIAISFGTQLMSKQIGDAELAIGAASIVSFIFSIFALAVAITHKVLTHKTAEQQ